MGESTQPESPPVLEDVGFYLDLYRISATRGGHQSMVAAGAPSDSGTDGGELEDAWRTATPNNPIPYSPPLEDAHSSHAEAIASEISRRLV